MIQAFEEAVSRFKELKQQLHTLDYTDLRTKALLKELKELQVLVDLYDTYSILQEQIQDCESIIQTTQDEDYIQMAEEEKQKLHIDLQKLMQTMQQQVASSDPNDSRNAILEIRPAAGGEEACLFAYELFRAYTHYAASQKLQVEVIDFSLSSTKGYKEVVALIKGDKAYKYFKFETGVHRVQRVPHTESSGRIHTSTVTVAVLFEVEEADVQLRDADIKVDTYRASGAGGQHVNKTDSAVRLTHLPTKIVVTCQDEKSQIKNKNKAMKVLRSRLYERERMMDKQKRDSLRKKQIGSGDRSEKIRTYNFHQGRITDHRIHTTIHQLSFFMEGRMHPLIQSLWEYAAQLESSSTS